MSEPKKSESKLLYLKKDKFINIEDIIYIET